MKIVRLKTNRIVNPLGFELNGPTFSWVVEDVVGPKQKWARLIISKSEQMNQPIYDSGEKENISSVAYSPKLRLEPRTRYYWTVTVSTDLGEIATSEVAWFETAKMDEQFVGEYIKPCLPYDVCPYLKKSFIVEEDVLKARAYFTGLGVYELYLNGEKLGDEFLAPGCDAYDKWIQYQTYDATDLIKKGENELVAIIGNGWAKGKFGFNIKYGSFEDNYKGEPCEAFTSEYLLKGDLIITTQNKELTIATDSSWESAPSPITFSGIYDGERYDSRIDLSNTKWEKTEVLNNHELGNLTARMSMPVKKMHEFKPKLIITPNGEKVLDIGQVISGFMTFYCNEESGTEIKLSYGELLQDDCFYRDNMRSALCEYRYISNGKRQFVRPITTFYGFRYVKLEGFEKEINIDDFTAWAIYSELETTGEIVTANEKVNRLFLNSLWSQRDNFVDVPTDCPQRDERMGWTGDAQVFCPTANFNMDCLQFYKKYGKDLWLDQMEHDGRVPHVAPLIFGKDQHFRVNDGGVCGWADAATIVPWVTYVYTGDISILQNQFDSMKAWADWQYAQDITHGGNGLWLETEFHFGDWLALDGAKSGFDPEAVIGGTDNTFLCSVYYYYSTTLVAKAARTLNKDDVAEVYEKRAERTLNAIQDEFFTSTGRLAADTQTGHAFALFYKLVPNGMKQRIVDRLIKLLQNNDMHLKTGFLGTPALCPALSANGANHEAYTLFLQEDLPSWLYEVNMGATTIWERWNSVLPNGKISGTSMNSMNHYAYGAIMEWVYKYVCGIKPIEKHPGFKKFELEPMPDKRLGSATAKFNSPAGYIESSWQYDGDNITYKFIVPFNTTAKVKISTKGLKQCAVNGLKINTDADFIEMQVGMGVYNIN